jgi:hypothetical protein
MLPGPRGAGRVVSRFFIQRIFESACQVPRKSPAESLQTHQPFFATSLPGPGSCLCASPAGVSGGLLEGESGKAGPRTRRGQVPILDRYKISMSVKVGRGSGAGLTGWTRIRLRMVTCQKLID